MEKSLDLITLFKILLKHIRFVILITLLVSVAAYIFSKVFIAPKYTSSALLYVENKMVSGEALSINDISAAQKLVDTCSIIFTSETIMNKLAKDKRISYSPETLKDMVRVNSENGTEIMRISVECYDPDEATYLTDKMVTLCMSEYSRIIQSGTITEVNAATHSKIPSSPNVFLNTLIGFLLGLLMACGIVLVNELLDTSVKASDDLAKLYDIPVFAEIADFDTGNKSKYKLSYKYAYKYDS